MALTKLNEVYKNWITGDGVFTDLNNLDVPWKSDDQVENIKTITSLNMAYHGAHSGDKNISPVVYKFLTADDAQTRAKLANIIFIMYVDKWAKLWETLQIEYNPLENYNMVENETPAETTHTMTPAETTETVTPAETTETVTPAETTETITPAGTTTETKPPKTTTENEVSAFNSSGYEDATKTTTTGDGNDKGVQTVSTNTAGTDKTETDTAGTNKFEVDTAGTNKFEVDNAGTDVFTVQNGRELTRSGNIGLTTSQQMLQSEIELRKWLYYQSVFNDIDNILTLSIY